MLRNSSIESGCGVIDPKKMYQYKEIYEIGRSHINKVFKIQSPRCLNEDRNQQAPPRIWMMEQELFGDSFLPYELELILFLGLRLEGPTWWFGIFMRRGITVPRVMS